MSTRLEMLQLARLAPRLLSDATELVAAFTDSQFHPAGGFIDRAGEPDLYYTVFGMDCLVALSRPIPHAPIETYLTGFGDGTALDLIHSCALLRCWANLGPPPQKVTDAVLAKVEAHVAGDGGYHVTMGMRKGSCYGNFLALGAYEAAGRPLPRPEAVLQNIRDLASRDGAFNDVPDMPVGTMPATAAAVAVTRALGHPLPASTGLWLLQQHHPEGGFFAVPGAPMPDLLSTAVCLHAMSLLKVPMDTIKEPCLDFVDSLWVNKGAFYGSWGDGYLDCEYLFYALLALGHLSI